jgi:hypothetical protein
MIQTGENRSRSPLTISLVIRIGLAVRVNLSKILQNLTRLEINGCRISFMASRTPNHM